MSLSTTAARATFLIRPLALVVFRVYVIFCRMTTSGKLLGRRLKQKVLKVNFLIKANKTARLTQSLYLKIKSNIILTYLKTNQKLLLHARCEITFMFQFENDQSLLNTKIIIEKECRYSIQVLNVYSGRSLRTGLWKLNSFYTYVQRNYQNIIVSESDWLRDKNPESTYDNRYLFNVTLPQMCQYFEQVTDT